MPTPVKLDTAVLDPDRVSLLIGGRVHRDWNRYDIDSDLLTPADAWQVTLGLPDGQFPPQVTPGAPVEVRVGTDTVMSGRIDEIRHALARGQHRLEINGRDGAAILLDCSAPQFNGRRAALSEVLASLVRPLGITRIALRSPHDPVLDKVDTEPGDTAWAVLARLAEAQGLWPWFEPDGTLVVGGPDYAAAPVASLVVRTSGTGNNVLSLSLSRNMAGRYSEVNVLGQSHGTAAGNGAHAVLATACDREVGHYRPRNVVDADVASAEAALTRARKLVNDARLDGLSLVAEVGGHRTAGGVLWAPGQRVHLLSEPHGLDAVYFLMARKFRGGRGLAATTVRTLKEDGSWNPEAAGRQENSNVA